MAKSLSIWIAAALCAGSAAAAVKFASPFGDGMVLQRGKSVAVWGTADAGEKVNVTFAGQAVSATAGADGRWLVRLAPMEASAEGRVLKANDAEVKDVLVGEVWLCSGQSNMSMRMWTPTKVCQHGNRDNNGYLDAMIVDEPLVRACTVPNVWSAEPKELAKPLVWKRFAPGTLQDLSAIGFHYALILHRTLKVPVGVIVSAWGGTCLETWVSPDGYRSVPALAANADRPIATTDPAPKKKGHRSSLHQQPRALWNAMIYPLVPYTFRGALWYQGESNRGQGLGYKDRLHALWNGWSKAFGDPKMPFYLVQIAPFDYGMNADNAGASACDIWEAEEAFARENPYAGMATIVDVGEHDNIHPGDKRTVAIRLAALALNRTYGRKDVPCDNPALKSSAVKGDTVTLTFDHVENWLMHGLDAAPFEIAGADGKFVPAKAKYLKGAVELRADGVAEPKQVRYLWNWCKAGRLKNDYGLPLPPFYVRAL
ncbi:MAG: hypothetical protein IJJ84_09570 [Kiritimatiellae bacterium]|nr:hypothetical protein [Kiritimatiellia bacterium]